MVRQAMGLLATALLLSACGQAFQEGQPPAAPQTVAPPTAALQGPPRLALLLPLTGPNAGVAASMAQAAQLAAAAAPGSPPLDLRDTGGDPGRAADAARASIAAGDRLILGPLTAEETQAVGTVAVPASIPVLSFSSDPAVAAPGVWTLGVTPGQQLRRLIAAARGEGRQHLAALLPEGPFGDALQAALVDAAGQAGFEPPAVQRAGEDGADEGALKSITNYDGRHGELEDRIRAMSQSTDPDSRQQAAVLAAQPVAPPPFDTLLLAARGDALRRLAERLPHYDVTGPQVRLLGPSFWSSGASRLHGLAGAWYALPDATQRDAFVTAFGAKYGAPPPPIADIAFDATLIGRSAAQDNDFSAGALTKEDGFSGVDGTMVLLPDGHVRRALAIYQIGRGGGATVVSPAPTDLSSPGS